MDQVEKRASDNTFEINHIWVYRIIAIQNLEKDLKNGLFARNTAIDDSSRIVIGNKEIINARGMRSVRCYPDTVVNDYVPFYFSVRTPMLLNIVTGMGVQKRDQGDIVYLCFRIEDLATDNSQWCFTNGNAAERITKFYNNLNDLDKIDWKSITATDFRTNNADGDEDRVRKKHAEFLVLNRVPIDKIGGIAVLNDAIKNDVETIVSKCNLAVEVKVKPDFYFL